MQCLKKCVRIVHLAYHKCNKLNPVQSRRYPLTYNVIFRLNHNSNVEDIHNEEGKEYVKLSNEYLGLVPGGQRVFVLQPYIKWGHQKKRNTTPELQLAEAVALVNTLEDWVVIGKMLVPLLSLRKKTLLGMGNMDKLKQQMHEAGNVTAVFVSTNLLRNIQVNELQEILGVRVYDRQSVIIQIFRKHAKSPEAKLQVAIAELPYVAKKILDLTEYHSDGRTIHEKRKMFLHRYHAKLKAALEKLKVHRHLIKRQRTDIGFPLVAIVGYTNCGKTSLIKALTNDEALCPENKLFATLDTTVHEGRLPCMLRTLYVDTIGFIQDVPELFLEPFKVTLQDAMDADVIVHVYDVSHPDMKAQYDHVEATLKGMISEEQPVIRVANKCDLVEKDKIPEGVLAISATKQIGTDILRLEVQKTLLAATGRMPMRFRVQTGSLAAAWLRKETAVSKAVPDPSNAQYIIIHAIVSERQLQRFKQFLKQ